MYVVAAKLIYMGIVIIKLPKFHRTPFEQVFVLLGLRSSVRVVIRRDFVPGIIWMIIRLIMPSSGWEDESPM